MNGARLVHVQLGLPQLQGVTRQPRTERRKPSENLNCLRMIYPETKDPIDGGVHVDSPGGGDVPVRR
jgi:hypothetical protein